MLEEIRRLAAHMRWADELALKSLHAGADASPQARRIYAHVLGAEQIWLARLRGVPIRYAVWPELDVEGCARLMAETHAEFDDYIASLDDDSLNRTVKYANSAGVEFDSRIGDILLHVMLHGAYHRGQVALLLRTAGAIPEPTDFIAFVRGAPAAVTPIR